MLTNLVTTSPRSSLMKIFLAVLAVTRGRADVPQVVTSSARLCEHANECYAG